MKKFIVLLLFAISFNTVYANPLDNEAIPEVVDLEPDIEITTNLDEDEYNYEPTENLYSKIQEPIQQQDTTENITEPPKNNTRLSEEEEWERNKAMIKRVFGDEFSDERLEELHQIALKPTQFSNGSSDELDSRAKGFMALYSDIPEKSWPKGGAAALQYPGITREEAKEYDATHMGTNIDQLVLSNPEMNSQYKKEVKEQSEDTGFVYILAGIIPIFLIVMIELSSKKNQTQNTKITKEIKKIKVCPFCGEKILPNAIYCAYCGKIVNNEVT